MGEPWFIPLFSVENGGLDIFVVAAYIARFDLEYFAVAQFHFRFFEEGAADGVGENAGGDGIETERGEYHK